MNRLPFYVIMLLLCTSLAFPLSVFIPDYMPSKIETDGNVIINATNITMNEINGNVKHSYVLITASNKVGGAEKELGTKTSDFKTSLKSGTFQGFNYYEIISEKHDEKLYGTTYEIEQIKAPPTLKDGGTQKLILDFMGTTNTVGSFNFTIYGVNVDPNINACGVLAGGATYTVTADINHLVGGTCLSANGNDVIINCQYFKITGMGMIGQVGIGSLFLRTEVHNCRIDTEETGISFNAVQNGVINGTNVSITVINGRGLIFTNVQTSTVTNSNFSSTQQYGGYLTGGSSSNTFTNVKFNSSTSYALFLDGASNSNSFKNSQMNSTSSTAIFVSGSDSNVFANSIINGSDNVNGAVAIQSGSDSNRFDNNTMDFHRGTYGIRTQIGANNNNVFFNNSFRQATGLVDLDVNTVGNTFYGNNFTNATTYYVQDTSGNNFYNLTINGVNEGNMWQNVVNGSVVITGNAQSVYFPLMAVGTGGAGYPYNATSSAKFICAFVRCADFRPLFFFANQVFAEFSTAATVSGGVIPTNTFIEFINYFTYPFGATSYAGCNMTVQANGSTVELSTTPTILNKSNQNFTFTGLNYGTVYLRECWVNNTVGMKASTGIRTVQIEDAPVVNNDFFMSAIVLALPIFAGIFIFLHKNSTGIAWKKLWYFMCCLFTITEILTIMIFAQDQGNTNIENLMLGLFIGFFWIFLFSLYLFVMEVIVYALQAIWKGLKM
jgi:hypothetical protein